MESAVSAGRPLDSIIFSVSADKNIDSSTFSHIISVVRTADSPVFSLLEAQHQLTERPSMSSSRIAVSADILVQPTSAFLSPVAA
jgi:hypothetical protein